MNQTLDDVQEVSKQLIEALKPVAQKIGEGGVAVYKMAVKDAFITGIENWINMGLGLMFLFIPIAVWQCIKKKKVPIPQADQNDPVMIARFEGMYEAAVTHNRLLEDDSRFVIILITSIVCVMFALMCILTNISNALHYTFNPEYMALKDLLAAIKK